MIYLGAPHDLYLSLEISVERQGIVCTKIQHAGHARRALALECVEPDLEAVSAQGAPTRFLIRQGVLDLETQQFGIESHGGLEVCGLKKR